MTRIVVTTTPDDIHAAAVACALERRGHELVALYASDLPRAATVAITVGASAPSVRVGDTVIDDATSVWLRRPTRPVLPADMHPHDRPVAERELDAVVRGLYDVLAPRALWVNPIDCHRGANSKLRQLASAREVGLAVPETLVSNDPARIRALLAAHPGEVIYKPFLPAVWRGGGERLYPLTAVLDETELPDDDVLRLTPGIFQPRIAKRHELRVTIIGDHVVTARIHSQDARATQLDWRADDARPPLELDALDPEIEVRCRALMRRLGIVFGCFDFIVTPMGEHVFLEVNEQGQWLWVEQALPEAFLLDRFSAMLAQGRPDFRWSRAEAVGYVAVARDAALRVRRERAAHVAAIEQHVIDEDAPCAAA
ncbi:MAG: hypothetical protein K8W52_16655 [Deltaproteobacteria bacterium]|nr:hypothetical protein [Deltaproteobacteria bacterium]